MSPVQMARTLTLGAPVLSILDAVPLPESVSLPIVRPRTSVPVVLGSKVSLLPPSALKAIDVRPVGKERMWTFHYEDGSKFQTNDPFTAEHMARELLAWRMK